jgi:hypothetical protein
MVRAFALAAVIGAFALPAAAETLVRVNVSGQDAKSAHETITRAAEAACQAELRGSSHFEQYYYRPDCIRAAVARAESEMRTAGLNAGTRDAHNGG